MVDWLAMRVLVLGGTARARRLASALVDAGIRLVTSLAGRTRSPGAVPGETRVGGFGGPDGLVAWLLEHRPEAVVDATHPYAAQMSSNAVSACERTGVRLVRYDVPSWRALPEAQSWTWVPDHAAAAAHLRNATGAVLLSVGRQPLPYYRELAGRPVLARMVDPPDGSLPAGWRLLLGRGPFGVEEERALLVGPPRVSNLVSKDSGGEQLDAKLVAARELGVGVVMVQRPVLPDADVVTGEPGVLDWLRHAS